MLSQTFSLIDILRLVTLVFLEGILSLDNALALSLIASNLPASKQKKALFIGLGSAIVLRAFGILGAAYLIQLFWIQLIGGGYLIFLSINHLRFFFFPKLKKPKKGPISFWKIVFFIELTDFAFAIDSILAGLALIGIEWHSFHLPPKIWIVYFGGIVGIILMRFAAKFFIYCIEKFPGLEVGAHLIVGWIGMKLFLEAFFKGFFFPHQKGVPLPLDLLFWGGIFFFFLSSFFFKKKEKPSPEKLD